MRECVTPRYDMHRPRRSQYHNSVVSNYCNDALKAAPNNTYYPTCLVAYLNRVGHRTRFLQKFIQHGFVKSPLWAIAELSTDAALVAAMHGKQSPIACTKGLTIFTMPGYVGMLSNTTCIQRH